MVQMQFWSWKQNKTWVLGYKNIAMEKHNKKLETSLKLSSSYFCLTGNKPNYLKNLQLCLGL